MCFSNSSIVCRNRVQDQSGERAPAPSPTRDNPPIRAPTCLSHPNVAPTTMRHHEFREITHIANKAKRRFLVRPSRAIVLAFQFGVLGTHSKPRSTSLPNSTRYSFHVKARRMKAPAFIPHPLTFDFILYPAPLSPHARPPFPASTTTASAFPAR